MSYQQPQYIQYQPINSTTNKQIYPTFTNYQTDATQTDDINLLPNQPVQYEERSRTETKTYQNPPTTQPVQYTNYQNETKAYVTNPPNQPSSSQPVHYENYRTETKSYTNPPQVYPQGQPTQYTNYRTYSKSYTVPPQQYGYQNVHNLPVDQVNANAPVQTYTNQGLPVDHINFGYQNNPYGQDNYNKGVGGQVDTAGRNLRGALGSFGHAIGNLGHAIFNAVDRGADAVGGNNMRKKEKKVKTETQTTTTTQVNQVGPSQP